jgi:phosphoglycerate dehydrogenase-like enzyme
VNDRGRAAGDHVAGGQQGPRRLKVIVGYPLMREQFHRLAAASPLVNVSYHELMTQAAADELHAPDLDAVIAPRIPSDLSRTPRLRWQQLASAGVDHLAANPPWKRGITLTNARGVYAIPIAQYVTAAILRIAERVEVRRRAQERHYWPEASEEDAYTGAILREQTLLIVGYGGIGREVARLAKPLGLRILAVKNRPEIRADGAYRVEGTGDPDGSLPDRLEGLEALDSLLGQADYVVLTLPLTPASRGMLNRERIAALGPRGGWLINVARGPLADENALAEALRERRLGGAVLDVFSTEPLPSDSPFWDLPNTVVTPHVSGADLTAPQTLADLFSQNLRRFAAGEPLLNVVDGDRQY